MATRADELVVVLAIFPQVCAVPVGPSSARVASHAPLFSGDDVVVANCTLLRPGVLLDVVLSQTYDLQLMSAILRPLYRLASPPAAGYSTGGWIGETTPDSAAYATGTAGPRSPPIGSTFVRINGLPSLRLAGI